MLVKDLKEFLNKVHDDFNVQFYCSKTIPKEELEMEGYPYPRNRDSYQAECGDIGYSEKEIIIEINLDIEE